MSELTNPLFDEKEFLERKKLEYERALVADVEKLKVQSMQVGKKSGYINLALSCKCWRLPRAT